MEVKMEVKLAITDICGAQCATCLQYRRPVKHTMSVEQVAKVLDIITPYTTHLFVNSVGDFLWLPNAQEYADLLGEWQKTGIYVSITTNCGWVGQPKLSCSVIVCSLNAIFEKCKSLLGLDFDRIVHNVRYLASTHGHVEVHVLRWGHNLVSDTDLLRLFDSCHVKIRVSEKCENQGMGHRQLQKEKNVCDYLQKIVIGADGTIELCAHDFFRQHPLGHINQLEDALRTQERIRKEWMTGNMPALCQWCNYTVPAHIYYIK